jgi:hypothetical protein
MGDRHFDAHVEGTDDEYGGRGAAARMGRVYHACGRAP